MPKVTRLGDVSADTMRETSTPILAIIARMAVNELANRAPVGYGMTAQEARERVTELEQSIRPRRPRLGRPRV